MWRHREFCRFDSALGSGSGSPCRQRFFAEDAERAAGNEMALNFESVVEGGVN
jgi:hypothetical protein